MKRYILNLLLLIFPPTRYFGIKRHIAKLADITVFDGVCINGMTCFFGRGKIVIEKNSWIGLKGTFYSTSGASITIGKNCDIGPEVSFINGSHKIGGGNRRAGIGISGDINIGDGCWIGARSTIHGGVTIGSGVIVASGSLVLKDVPPNCLVAGIPAVIKRKLTNNG